MTARILFDARHIRHVYSGLARYTYSLLVGLIEETELYERLDILLEAGVDYQDNPLYRHLSERGGSKVRFVFVEAPLFRFRHHFAVSKYVNNSDCDMFFYPYFDVPVGIRKRTIFVVHDLFVLLMKDYVVNWRVPKTLYYRWVLEKALMREDATCVTVSRTTESDVRRFFPNAQAAIVPVWESWFPAPLPGARTGIASKWGRYLFYVGDRRPHKNLPMVVDVFREMKRRGYPGTLVLAGSRANFGLDLDAYIGGDPSILTVGNLSDEDLLDSYNGMDALVFLSRYEGFGLPVLEAARHGARIIASGCGALAEIMPPGALQVDLDSSATTIAESVLPYLELPKPPPDKQYLAQFDWHASARAVFSRGGPFPHPHHVKIHE